MVIDKSRAEIYYSTILSLQRRNRRFKRMVDFMCMSTTWPPGRYTVREKTLIVGTVVAFWDHPNEETAAMLAKFLSLEGDDLSEYVAYLKRPVEKKYREIMGREWWQFWRPRNEDCAAGI